MISMDDKDTYKNVAAYLADEFELDAEETAEMFEEYLDVTADFLTQIAGNIDTGQFEAIAKDSHCLKGSSINIDAKLMAVLAKKLELAAKAGNAEGCRETLAKMQSNYDYMKQSFNQ